MSFRIYVASLSDYNAGTLHGTWIEDLHVKDGEQVLEEVRVMLSTSQEGIAEEWAIHDHEGFGSVIVTENSRFDELCKLAALIEEHGHVPVAEAIDHEDEPEEIPDWIADHYHGKYESPCDYAQELTEECYSTELERMPGFLKNNIDWQSVARDMEYDGWRFVETGWKECHVFSP